MSEFPNNPEDVGAQMESPLAKRLNDAEVFPSKQGGTSDTNSLPEHYKLMCPQGRKILLSPAPDVPGSGISTAGDEWSGGGPYEEVSLSEAGIDGLHLLQPQATRQSSVRVAFGSGYCSQGACQFFNLPRVVVWNSTDQVIWDDEEGKWVDYE